MVNPKKTTFTIECVGLSGAGKSTYLSRLADALRERNTQVLIVSNTDVTEKRFGKSRFLPALKIMANLRMLSPRILCVSRSLVTTDKRTFLRDIKRWSFFIYLFQTYKQQDGVVLFDHGPAHRAYGLFKAGRLRDPRGFIRCLAKYNLLCDLTVFMEPEPATIYRNRTNTRGLSKSETGPEGELEKITTEQTSVARYRQLFVERLDQNRELSVRVERDNSEPTILKLIDTIIVTTIGS